MCAILELLAGKIRNTAPGTECIMATAINYAHAAVARTGFLEHTHQGTLFLDEIGDLPLGLQGKLLQVGEFSRVGSSDQVRVDLRFIAATNNDRDRMMARKAFHQDLYYLLA